MPNLVLQSISEQNVRATLRNSAWQEDQEIAAQFVRVAHGGEDQEITCNTLFDEEKERHVGFIGLALAEEDLGSTVEVYVSVEFVYLDPRYRGQGLSELLMDYVVSATKLWLSQSPGKWNGRKVCLHSASTPRSQAGELFVEKLDDHLRSLSKDLGFRFRSFSA